MMNQPDPNRSAGGKFAKGNTISSKGGQARAAKLSKRRRRQIAKQGFQALVDKRFNGNRQLAKNWVGDIGAHNYAKSTGLRLKACFAHPGEPEEYVARALSKMGNPDEEIDFGFFEGSQSCSD